MKRRFRKSLRYWLGMLPGRKRDYFFIGLVIIDLLLLLIRNSYSGILFGKNIDGAILAFDFAVIFLWFFYFVSRLHRAEDRWKFIRLHWYEILGMIPLIMFRLFLLLRVTKFAIAFYKFGRSERDVSRMITRDITFRFRDVIVDTIADAVFLKSLQRVEEVMMRLDYAQVARQAFSQHQDRLRIAVNDTLKNTPVVGEISRLPLMSGITEKLGESLSQVTREIFVSEAAGYIMKDITRSILSEMSERVRVLDIERLTGQNIELEQAREIKEKKMHTARRHINMD